MLLAALAVCILATLAGLVVFTRAALRLNRRLARLQAARATTLELVGRAKELGARAETVRADSERLRSIAGLFT